MESHGIKIFTDHVSQDSPRQKIVYWAERVGVQSGDFSWQTDCFEILMRYLTALSGEQHILTLRIPSDSLTRTNPFIKLSSSQPEPHVVGWRGQPVARPGRSILLFIKFMFSVCISVGRLAVMITINLVPAASVSVCAGEVVTAHKIMNQLCGFTN